MNSILHQISISIPIPIVGGYKQHNTANNIDTVKVKCEKLFKKRKLYLAIRVCLMYIQIPFVATVFSLFLSILPQRYHRILQEFSISVESRFGFRAISSFQGLDASQLAANAKTIDAILSIERVSRRYTAHNIVKFR